MHRRIGPDYEVGVAESGGLVVVAGPGRRASEKELLQSRHRQPRPWQSPSRWRSPRYRSWESAWREKKCESGGRSTRDDEPRRAALRGVGAIGRSSTRPCTSRVRKSPRTQRRYTYTSAHFTVGGDPTVCRWVQLPPGAISSARGTSGQRPMLIQYLLY